MTCNSHRHPQTINSSIAEKVWGSSRVHDKTRQPRRVDRILNACVRTIPLSEVGYNLLDGIAKEPFKHLEPFGLPSRLFF